MKKINTSNITTTAGFYPKKGTIDHLQQAYQEAISALMRCNLADYSPTTAYILYGVTVTNNGNGTSTWAAGAVYYGGEVYLVDAVTLSNTLGGGQAYIGTITTTNVTSSIADPVLFTDGSSHNVHEIRKIVISIGTSGAGVGNFSSFVNVLRDMPAVTSIQTAPTVITFTGNTINLSDVQAPISPITYTYDFTGAVIGAKNGQYIGIDQTSVSISFPNTTGDKVTLLPLGKTNPFTASDAIGDKPMYLEFEYLGQDIYNTHVVRVLINHTS